MVHVGIYLRISLDRDGTQTATARQRAECIRYAEARGWTVADVFEDVDLSAYKRDVVRGEFQRMIEAVRSKQIDGVLAWKLDRLSRRMREFVALDDTCEEVGGFIATVVESLDTRSPTGRFVAELLTAQARMESENSSVRVKAKHAELALKGIPVRGGHRMYGYTRSREIIPDEAANIRDAMKRIYAGESCHSIADDFNRRGITTSKGGPWRNGTLRRLLMRAALSGQREYRGTLTPGTWEPIITPEDTTRLRSLLRRRESVTTGRYLLTGLIYCGRCERPMWGHRDEYQRPRYACVKQPGNGNCGRMARLASRIDEEVVNRFLGVLDSEAVAAYLGDGVDAESDRLIMEIRADEDMLVTLADDYADRRISRDEWLRQRDRVTQRLDANRRMLAQAGRRGLLSSLAGTGDDLRRTWEEHSRTFQREALATLIERVTVLPAVQGRKTFDTDRVVVTWVI